MFWDLAQSVNSSRTVTAGLHSKKSLNKLHNKAKRSLCKSYGLLVGPSKTPLDNLAKIFSPDPTPWMMLANMGAATHAAVLAALHDRAQVQPIVVHMSSCLPFVLATFANAEDAKRVRGAVHGEHIPEWKNQLIFAEYLLEDMEQAFLATTDATPTLLLDHKRTDTDAKLPLPFVQLADLKSLDWQTLVQECPESVPPGLVVVPDFVTDPEAAQLMAYCETQPWAEKMLRHVQHYGYIFDYKTNLPVRVGDADNHTDTSQTSEDELFPSAFTAVLNRVRKNIPSTTSVSYDTSTIAQQQWSGFVANQITVNKYLPGHGIPRHIDTHSAFTDCIFSLSMGSAIVMEFRLHPGRTATDRETVLKTVKVLVPARSLLILSGPARYTWTHGIAARTTDVVNGAVINRNKRVSFTFRNVLQVQKCKCPFRQHCDDPETAPPDVLKNQPKKRRKTDKGLPHPYNNTDEGLL